MNPENSAYLRFPTIFEDTIVFVSEDALWEVSATGGIAHRLTNTPGIVSFPRFSPDGKWIAYSALDDGSTQVYVIPAHGGESRRLVFYPTPCIVTGWNPANGKVIFRGAMQSHNARHELLYMVSPEGGPLEEIPFGPANTIDFDADGDHIILHRGYPDPAVWKRYKGGRCGEIWYGSFSQQTFQCLRKPDMAQAGPFIYDGRIYFISDFEGTANLYSFKPDGSDCKQHTFHKDFYVRYPAHHNHIVVYQMAGDLWKLDLKTGENQKLPIQLPACGCSLRKRFVLASQYLQGYALSPKNDKLLVNTRGQLMVSPLWKGPVKTLEQNPGIRNRLACWHPDNQKIIAVSDSSGEEEMVMYDTEKDTTKRFGKIGEGGYIQQIVPAPKGEKVALAVSSTLYVVSLDTGEAKQIDQTNHRYFREFSWSSDGRWLAYAKFQGEHNYASIFLYSIESGQITRITQDEAHDYCPCFDPKGRYLYFLSKRIFNPYEDSLQNDYSFPATARPYLVMLKASDFSPFSFMGALDKDKDDEDKDEDKDKDKEAEEKAPTAKKGKKGQNKGQEKESKVEIDLEGIQERIQEIPIKEGKLLSLSVVEDKIMVLEKLVTGELGDPVFWQDSTTPNLRLNLYDLKELKDKILAKKVTWVSHAPGSKKMLLRVGYQLRIVNAGEEVKEDVDDRPGKENGWFDFGRIKVMIDPKSEWRQMLQEAWRWQRDFFWRMDMNGVDWNKIKEKYFVLFDKIRTRNELNDLMCEIYGELDTSHAYVMFGELPETPIYKVGTLGVDLELDKISGRFRLKRIYQGDLSVKSRRCPLTEPGMNVKQGEYLLRINGQAIDQKHLPYEYLLNRSNCEVEVLISPTPLEKDGRKLIVTTASSEIVIRYHQWVRDNRAYVAEKTQGRVGYIHLPDMSIAGLISFHRDFLWQFNRQGLIVDVRYNGGGHVSEVILSKLQRKAIGYSIPRKGDIEAYPYQTMRGPMVALCDEHTGSDGDVFCQAFKDLGLGTLIGRRTWGGVVGIQCDKRLVDGGIVTQPEVAFWFKSRGWAIENYGVVPDIEVSYDPASYAKGKDPQLDRGIEEILKKLETYKEQKPDHL